ncbi:MAG: prolipoprotein diacylglyceryl transferase [Mycoplasmataceae bacterium]|nr:prolipoprotein diacylglyceryl transferase [Mycoplasmataceae bacterium]
MFKDRKSVGIWLGSTLPIAVVVPLLFFVLITTLCRGAWTPEASTAFSIGSLEVKWYGICILGGFLCAIALACLKLWKLYKCPIDPFYWFCLLGIPLAILGARFGSYVIGDASANDPTWSNFFDFRSGGLAIEWGVMFVVAAALIWFPLILKRPKYQVRDLTTEPNKVRKISMWVYVDAIAPAIFIGQVLGRWGNYMNQEVYGSIISSGGYKDFITNLLPYMQNGANVYQPLFLYEGIANFFGLILIYFVAELIPKKRCGDLGLCYFLWYGIVRAVMNPFRDQTYAFNAVSITVSIIWVVVAIVLIILNHTVLVNIRKYKISSTLFTRTKIAFTYNPTISSLERASLKGRELSSNLIRETNTERRVILKELLDKNTGKITALNTKLDKLNQLKNNLRINFVRTDDETLYYLGR